MSDDPQSPRQETQKRSPNWWAVFGALLVAIAVPCPECGGPLVLHIWPLVALLIAARALAGHARPSENDAKTATDESSNPDITGDLE
jgi:hypothetical protein